MSFLFIPEKEMFILYNDPFDVKESKSNKRIAFNLHTPATAMHLAYTVYKYLLPKKDLKSIVSSLKNKKQI